MLLSKGCSEIQHNLVSHIANKRKQKEARLSENTMSNQKGKEHEDKPAFYDEDGRVAPPSIGGKKSAGIAPAKELKKKNMVEPQVQVEIMTPAGANEVPLRSNIAANSGKGDAVRVGAFVKDMVAMMVMMKRKASLVGTPL